MYYWLVAEEPINDWVLLSVRMWCSTRLTSVLKYMYEM